MAGIGVRGGGSGAAAAPPGLKISGQTLFSGQPQVSQKPWIIKYISVQWKIPGQRFFRASPSCSKILNNKKNTFNILNSGHPLFFRASASCSKFLNNKKYIFSTLNSGNPLFFRASASCSKIQNVKSIFHTAKNFRATLFFRASASCSNPEW